MKIASCKYITPVFCVNILIERFESTAAKASPENLRRNYMKKQMIALILALCLLAGIGPGGAQAASSYTVYVVSNTLPVYSKVSAGASMLGSMSFGESMTCLAVNSSWAAVKNAKGQIGYCQISGLSTANPNTLNKTAYINSANVPVYRKPSTSSGVMMKLALNASYPAVAVTPDKNWVRLQNGNAFGYVQAQYISAAPVGGTQSSVQTPAANTTVYIVSNTLNAHQSPSSSSRVLGVMSYGESMLLLDTSGSWARIKNASGAVGYCSIAGLSASNPNNYNHTVYINTDGAKVYRKPGAGSAVMASVKKNVSFTAVAVTPDGGWVRLKNGNAYGYVQAQYVSRELTSNDLPGMEATAAYVTSNTLPVYAGPDTGSRLLGTMAFGENLTLLNVSDGWAQVRNSSGAVGYCSFGGLGKNNPNTLSTTGYAVEDGVKLYAKPASGASVSASLKKNDAVTVVAATEDGLWLRVLWGGKYLYAVRAKLSGEKTAVDGSAIQDLSPFAVYIAVNTLNCHAQNNTASSVIGVMSYGEGFTCTGAGGGWARIVNASGAVGYCRQDGLTKTNPNTYSQTLYAQTSGVKVYAKPSTSSSVLKTLNLNARVTAVAYTPDKAWIRLQNGSSYGYCPSPYLANSPVSNPQENSTISKVISLAQKQLGIEYKYACQSPSSGFDCSGLTYYVYLNAANIKLKRTAYTQATDSKYASVSRGSLKAGDLVFFTNTYATSAAASHVGIYMGDNLFIHAANGGVKVTSLDHEYYAPRYIGARRIV